MQHKYWDTYYRGTIGKWTDLFKKGDEKQIKESLYKRYLELRFKLTDIINEMNDLEKKVEENYPLLRSVPTTNDPKENQIFLNELIIYINSKN